MSSVHPEVMAIQAKLNELGPELADLDMLLPELFSEVKGNEDDSFQKDFYKVIEGLIHYSN